mmetsp:Transcript_22795/g.63375  ORF Transcript_22795/g.63375 Transcript_22795/m.63375 type:complete len:299 (+) Transcript_22795:6971-7867(+)
MIEPNNNEKGSEYAELSTKGNVALTSADNNDDDGDDEDEDEEDDDDEYSEIFRSLRSATGLEIGVKVTWPDCRELSLSTTLEEAEIAPMFHGTQWAGTRVWRAAVVALQYLLLDRNDSGNSKHPAIPLINNETSILELGCGLGVPGMLLHEIKKCSVVLSDKDSLVEQLRDNLQRNFAKVDARNPRIEAHALDWSTEGVDSLLKRVGSNAFDVVLNCDCVYEPLYGLSWRSLVECQKALLKRHPHTILITSLERRKADGVENYLEGLRGIAQRVESIEIPFPHSPEVKMFIAYGALLG